ncbi:MAG: hypothetical protein L0177_12240 [Chloroflexi bacterium]|nr:hypothetical protein [Chloroflexota bacterium]
MRGFILNRLKFAAIPIIAGVLAFSAAISAHADGPAQNASASVKHGIFGMVIGKTETTIVVQTNQGATVELGVDASTRFRVPGEAEAGFGDVPDGSRVAILAAGEAEASSALNVTVIPGKPQRQHRVLTVVDFSGNIAIAEDAEGNKIEVELDRQVSGEFKGQVVTFVGARAEQSDRFRARAEVKIEQVVDRLERHVKNIEAEVKAEARAEVKARKQENLDRIKVRLDANVERHLNLFAQVVADAPESSRPALQATLEQHKERYEARLVTLGRADVDLDAHIEARVAQGAIARVDAASGVIVVKTPRGEDLRFSVGRDARIAVNGKAAAFSDISAGDEVTVRYNGRTSAAMEIMIKAEAEARGTIESVDAARGTMTIRLPSGGSTEIKIASDTSVDIGGRQQTEAALRPGATVEVKYNSKTGEAQVVEADANVKIKGKVRRVNRVEGTVTITTESGREVTIHVSKVTLVNARRLLSALADISEGMEVEAEYNLNTGVASELKASVRDDGSAKIRARLTGAGRIARIDVRSREITVELDNGETLTIKVDNATIVRLNGRGVAFADIKAGARVEVEYDSESRLASLIAAKLENANETEASGSGSASATVSASGTLRAANALARTVTIVRDDGTELTLRIGSDARILLNGAASGLLALARHIGSRVEVVYDASASVATTISAKSETTVETGEQTATEIKTEAEASASATVSGSLRAVNALSRTVIIVQQDGTELALMVASDTMILLNGAVSGLVELASRVGSQVEIVYDASASVATSISAKSETEVITGSQTTVESTTKVAVDAQASVSGTLRAVNTLSNTVTIVTEDGRELALRVASDAKILVSGAASGLVELASRIGSQVEVTYDASAMVAASLTVEAQSAAGTEAPTAGTTAASTTQTSSSLAGALK